MIRKNRKTRKRLRRIRRKQNNRKAMFKLDFTRKELEEILSKIYINDFQKRILEYRMLGYSIVKMSMLEHCSESTIKREIRKIKNKIYKVI